MTLFKTASFVLFFISLIYIPTYSSHAQLISSEIYETEEDLQTGLELGLLTYDQYLELLDMLQTKVLPASEETEKLEFIPDVSSVDVSQIKAQNEDITLSQKTYSFLEKGSNKIRPLFSGKLVWRFYEKFHQESETENYLLCEIKTGMHLIWHMEADKKINSPETMFGRGDFRFRKRFIKFLLPPYTTEITLGNFDKRIGLGLNIGYHPYFGYSDESYQKFEDSFLYPALGRFNGVLGESGFKHWSILVFYSRNKREEIEDQISALDLGFLSSNFKVGLCISEGKLKNIDNGNTFADDCKSLHFDIKFEPISFTSEYALLTNQKNAMAFNLHSRQKSYSFDFSGWRYDDDFIHPHGGGVSNPDYETIDLDEIDYQYRSRQAGESGIFFKSRYNVFDRLNLSFSYNQWKEQSYLPDKMEFRVGTGYEFSKSFSFMIYQLWTDYRVEDEYIDRKVSSLNLFFSLYSKLDLNLIGNYRNASDKNYGDVRLKVSTQLLSPFDFVLWLKYNDPSFSRSSDGYFSFHMQEKIRFFENYFVLAEYISKFYQGEEKVDTKAVRIRMEAVW